MSYRRHHAQERTAAKAGMSARMARQIEGDGTLRSQKSRRYWRSCPGRLAGVIRCGTFIVRGISVQRPVTAEPPPAESVAVQRPVGLLLIGECEAAGGGFAIWSKKRKFVGEDGETGRKQKTCTVTATVGLAVAMLVSVGVFGGLPCGAD